MKVQELIDQLNTMNPEAEVLLARDAEGNGYSPCTAFSTDLKLVPTWSADAAVFNQVDVNEGAFTQKDYDDAPDCVVLWPRT